MDVARNGLLFAPIREKNLFSLVIVPIGLIIFSRRPLPFCFTSDIELFINEYASNSNLKLQSILEDLSDIKILNSVSTLSFFHVHLTEPYCYL